MSTLTITLKKTQLVENRVGANYFVIAQMNQVQAMNEQSKVIKQRTDISVNTNSGKPVFLKNKMHFRDIDTTGQSRTTIDFIVYMSPNDADYETVTSQELVSKSKMVGQCQQLFTRQFLARIKTDDLSAGVVTQSFKLSNIPLEDQMNSEIDEYNQPQGDKDYIGFITVEYKLVIHDVGEQIQLSNQLLEQYYYDPFEKNDKVVSEKLSKIEKISQQKIVELDQLYKKVDDRNKVLQGLAIDLGQIKKEKDQKDDLKQRAQTELDKLQKVNEIHIEIDVLQDTPKGVRQLQERYFTLLQQIEAQERIRDQMTKQFKNSEVYHKLKAFQQLQKNLEFYDDSLAKNKQRVQVIKQQFEEAKQKRETVQSQEELIKNLSQSIKRQSDFHKMDNRDQQNLMLESKQKQNDVEQLRFQRDQMKEKLKQLQLLRNLNGQNFEDGLIPEVELDQLNIQYIDNGVKKDEGKPLHQINLVHSKSIVELKQREDYYYQMIQESIQELDQIKKARDNMDINKVQQNFNKQQFYEGLDGNMPQKQQMMNEVLNLQASNQQFEKEMQLKANLNTNTLEDMRYQIMMLDLQIGDAQHMLR